MFIEQSIKPDNKFWKYIVGFMLIIAALAVGNVPLILAIFVKSMAEGGSFPTAENDLMTVLDANLTLFLLLLSFAFGLLGVYFAVRFLHNQTVREVTTGRSTVDWKRIFFSFGLWAVFLVGSTAIMYFQNPDHFVVNFQPVPFAILVGVAVLMMPIQTSAEEYIFRGYLMQGFANLTFNKWFPLLMTSVIFGLMHILNPEVEKMGYVVLVYYIGTGLFLGIITLMDDGLELALGFHAANNLIGALLLTSDWTVFQTPSLLKDISEPTAGFEVIFPVLVIFPLLLFIFSKKYGWNGWMEKLTGNIDRISDQVTNPTIKNDESELS